MNTTFAGSNFFDSKFEALLVTSVFISTALVLPFNSYVTWQILTGTTLASDIFHLHLALTEIFISFSNLWSLGYIQANCFPCFQVVTFTLGFFFTARPLFQCCICVDCYVGVVHPVLYLRCKALRYRVACCCAGWLITLVSCIYSICTNFNSLYLYYFFIQNVLFFFTMLFCCLSVLRTLKHPGPGENTTEKKSNAMKRKAFKIILLTLISMSVTFFLYVVAIPLQCCLMLEEFLSAFTVCNILALSSGIIQPLTYLRKVGKVPCFRH